MPAGEKKKEIESVIRNRFEQYHLIERLPGIDRDINSRQILTNYWNIGD
jgi:hypothetical protein